jgi:hypothetical protein
MAVLAPQITNLITTNDPNPNESIPFEARDTAPSLNEMTLNLPMDLANEYCKIDFFNDLIPILRKHYAPRSPDDLHNHDSQSENNALPSVPGQPGPVDSMPPTATGLPKVKEEVGSSQFT